MLNFRGENPADILELVRDVECSSPILQDHVVPLKSRPQRAAYCHNGVWLKVCSKSKKFINLQTLRSSFKFLVKGRFRAAASLLLASHKPISDTDIVATWVRVKNNVLVLYPNLGLACKIRKPNSIRDAESLYNEYLVLKSVEGFTGLNAPEPIVYQEEPAPALYMRYVEGRSVKKGEKSFIAFRIAESLLDWYEHSGIQIIRANMYEPLIDIVRSGVSGLKGKGWSSTDASVIHTTLSTVADSEMPLVVAQIHGDASTGNAMITGDDGLVVTDWENSRRDLVVYDLSKLIHLNPKIESRYSEWLFTNMDIAETNPANELAFAIVLSSIELNMYRHYFSHVACHSKQDTEARLEAIRRQVLDACAMLKS